MSDLRFWRPDQLVRPLVDGARGSGERAGSVGVAHFTPGLYPACSRHGALTAIGGGKWRCLVVGCNAGAQTPWPWVSRRPRRWAWRTVSNPWHPGGRGWAGRAGPARLPHPLAGRVGEPVIELCRGSNGNALLEFADGFRTVAPWRAAR